MANPPPAGRWIRLATMRPTAVPAPEPPPTQPPVPQIRPTLGRTFTIGFRPSIPQVPQPQQTVVLPPPPPPIVQPAPLPPQLLSVRDVSSPPPVPPIVSPSPPKTPPPPAPTTAPSPRHTPPQAATMVPSPQRTPPPAVTAVPSPRRTPPHASATPTEVSPSPRVALPAILPNAVVSPPKSPVAPTFSPPPKSQLAPTSSPPLLPRTPTGLAASAVPPQVIPPTSAFNEIANAPPPPESPGPASAPALVPSSPLQTYPVPTSASGSTTVGRISPNASKPPSPRPATFLAPTTSQRTSVSKVVTFSSVTTVPNPVETPILVPTANNRGTSPATSPKTTLKAPERTPPQSPMIRFSNDPPSPLHLPPPQLKSDEDYEPKIPPEAEKKTVLFQKIIDQPKPTVHNDVNSGQIDSRDTFKARNSANHGRHEAAKGFETKEKGMHKKITGFDELGVRNLTIAGENKGAVMELGYSQRKQDHFPGHPHTLQSTQNDNSKSNGKASENHSSGEGKSKNGKNQMKNAMSSPPMNAIANSNVQGINNSLFFNSSCTHHDPGVHLSLTRKPSNGHKFHFKDDANGHHS